MRRRRSPSALAATPLTPHFAHIQLTPTPMVNLHSPGSGRMSWSGPGGRRKRGCERKPAAPLPLMPYRRQARGQRQQAQRRQQRGRLTRWIGLTLSASAQVKKQWME